MRSSSRCTWLGAAAAMLAGLRAAAAADLDVPLRGSVDIPPPPGAVEYEVGLRYWYSQGNTAWNHDASRVAPIYGNPTSKLSYRDLEGHSGEVFARIHHADTGLFIKGIAGLGAVTDGELQDQDWLAGGIEFSDTSSGVDGDAFHYAMVDVGWSPFDLGYARLGGFVGYHYWQERLDAFGAQCNPDDLDGYYCPTGVDVIPSNLMAISNEVEYHAFRVGVDGRVDLPYGFSLGGDVAWVPYALFENEDSHYWRDDLGAVPNIHHTGESMGVEAEALLKYRASSFVEVAAGARYWGLWGDGDIAFGSRAARKLPVNDFDSERYGLLLQAAYRF